MAGIWQQPLPKIYNQLSDAELRVRLALAKEKLASRLVILGHHYQQDEVIEFADFVGDSFELSRKAAEQKGIEFVVFCGVHFMAESADILTDEKVRVVLPDLGAGCSMADMANLDQTLVAWDQLAETCPEGKVKVLFFPDQHLGRNTAYALGYPLDKMVVWDPKQDLEGNSEDALREADFVLWKGHCSVHQLFRPEHVDQVREKYPDMKVLVHPECRWEVVQKADLTGSTAYIVKQIEAAPPGSQWAIGTEVHLINRLAKQHPEQKIIVLSDCQCLCTTMFRIDLKHLCWAVENLATGNVVNEIKVDAHTRKWATVALERMLTIKGTPTPDQRESQAIVTVD